MINREIDSKAMNNQVGNLCVLLGLFPGSDTTKKSSLEFIVRSTADNQFGLWKNQDLWNAICDHKEACQEGNFIKRIAALNKLKIEIQDVPGNRSDFYKEKAAILSNLDNIIKLAAVSDQKDNEDTPRQFLNLLEMLAKTIQAEGNNQENVLKTLEELSSYINKRIETEKENNPDFNEIAVYKECIKEINARFDLQYSTAVSNLQSELKSYGDYLRAFKSDDIVIKARIAKCEELIRLSANTKIDSLARITKLSQGLKDMDTDLILKLEGKEVKVNKCSAHHNNAVFSAFNQVLDIIGKHFPSVLQYKKGISDTLLQVDVTQDVRQSLRGRGK